MTEKITTSGGTLLTWHHRAPGTPTVVIWPALGPAGRSYSRLADQLATRGLGVAVADYRGQGDSPVAISRSSRFGYDDLADDMAEALVHVRAENTGPLIQFGHSLGGQLTLALEARHPGSFDALALVASSTPHWRHYPGRLALTPLVGTFLAVLSARARGSLHGHRQGLGHQATSLVEDWARMARTGSWSRRPPVVASRRFPLLAVSIADDQLAPVPAIDALASSFPGAEITRRHIEVPGGHSG